MRTASCLSAVVIVVSALTVSAAEKRCVNGVYPHLAMYNNEGECGTGAVVPWAGRLWVVTYGPHLIRGSSDKLYEITPELEQIVRPESSGGTHANRMIHTESQQLFIGYHAIGVDGTVRTIPWSVMPGRLTGAARHLTEPADMIYMATMEEGLYEIDVRTLAVKELIRDGNVRNTTGLDLPADTFHSKLPGYHGKGLYSGQGRLVYSNNGERGGSALSDPTTTSGALAEWQGEGDWQLIRRSQFTEVRGPGDLAGNPNPATDPVWALGWDHRSVLLMLLDGGAWTTFRLPKASHSYDGAHGWNTEWPRTRDIGEDAMLGTMHGTFWRFPKAFSLRRSAGIAPRSNYLKVVGDFCRWQERIVLGCDDSAQKEFLNKRPLKSRHGAPGQSNSNLWFIEPETLDRLGPAIGRGSVWLREDVEANVASDPYLFAGYDHRMAWLSHDTAVPVTFALEVDRNGNGEWTALRSIQLPPRSSTYCIFAAEETGAWIRVRTPRAVSRATVHFQYRNQDGRSGDTDPMFADIARAGEPSSVGGIMRCLGGNKRTMGLVAADPATGDELGYYELDGDLNLRKSEDAGGPAYVLAGVPPADVVEVDAASVILTEDGKRFRIPASPAHVRPVEQATETTEPPVEEEQPNLALGATVTVSSTHGEYAAAHAVDGKATEKSRWVSAPDGEKWIVLDLGAEQSIACARIISGYDRKAGTMVADARFQLESVGKWVDVPGGAIAGNRQVTRTVNFKEPVSAQRIRLVSTDTKYMRIYELELYAKPRTDVKPAADLTVSRVCREAATERDLVNCLGTFYELPARNAGGLPKIRPVATHDLAIHDYASYRGMLVLTGIDPEALTAGGNEHLVVSDDRKCAVWCGVIDDLWKLGKPRGQGGPWKDTTVEAGVPSDPYLMTAYDRKSIALSHAADGVVTFTVEVDPDGTGLWCAYRRFTVAGGKTVTHEFPTGFSAYWVRVASDTSTTATAWLTYE